MRRSLITAVVALATLLPAGAAGAIPGDPGDPPEDTTPPTITIATPGASVIYQRGGSTAADFSCADELALASCTGTVADGVAIPASQVSNSIAFTVQAEDEAGNTSSKTVTYAVRDWLPPTISIASPITGAQYTRGQVVNASYTCSDPLGGTVNGCAGPSPSGTAINTSTLGIKTFTVVATDAYGNMSQVSKSYVVVDGTDPTVTISAPLDGATVVRGQPLTADFTCADETGGSGLVSCTGDVADGAALSTGTVGSYTFSVTAVDGEGNSTEATVGYEVVAPRCAGRAVTVMLALGDQPTTGADVILGTPVRNVVDGRGGPDTICGLGGNDLLTGGSGIDLLDGGPGQDRLVGGTQRDTCRGGAQRDTHSGCEVRTGFP